MVTSRGENILRLNCIKNSSDADAAVAANTVTNTSAVVNSASATDSNTIDSPISGNALSNNRDSTTITTHNPSNTNTSKSIALINDTTNVMVTENAYLPKALPPPQLVVISKQTNVSEATATNAAAKRIRRAISMPRNPFRWSRKFKTFTLNSSITQGSVCTAAAAADNDDDSSVGGNSSENCIKASNTRCSKQNGDVGGVANLIGKTTSLTFCVNRNRKESSGSTISLNEFKTTKEELQQTIIADADDHDPNDNENDRIDNNSNDNNSENNNQNSIKTAAISSSANPNCTPKINASTAKPPASSSGSASASLSSNRNNDLTTSKRIFRRSSFRKFLNRITQHMTSNQKSTDVKTSTNHAVLDRVPPLGSHQWSQDQTPGVMGLKNHGNTCFMNAVLQCLSHTDILAEYFVLDQYKADLKRRNKTNSRKFGTKGELTEELANVLKALWTCKNESDHSTSFKAVVERYGAQFRSSTQHDAQEFLFWLLDKVHEDLNTATKRRYKTVKNNCGRSDEVIAAETLANHLRCNNSFVQAVFQAQFRSSLTCPRCQKQSNTFDPFHCISVQLPQVVQQTIFVTVVYLKQQPRQVRMGLTVPAGSPIVALREQLSKQAGIAINCMVLVDLQADGFSRVYYDSQPLSSLDGSNTIYCIEVEAGQAVEMTDNGSKPQSSELLLLVANVRKSKTSTTTNCGESCVEEESKLERFGPPFAMQVPRDCSYVELQKILLREMCLLLKPGLFSYSVPLSEMFQIRLQDPSVDSDAYVENVEHPLLTEMIDLALSVLSAEAGPPHIKLLLEWSDPAAHFNDLTDNIVEDESVPRLMASKAKDTAALTLEQCLEHYTKAETLSAEDAWHCPYCQQYLPVVKTLGLWSLPDILVVHFKRFRQHHGKGASAAKLTTMVKFPLYSFDMSPHLAKAADDMKLQSNLNIEVNNSLSLGHRSSPWRRSRSGDSRSSTLSSRSNKETCYDLYAVCYHQGDTLETGHYTAACKNPYDRQWYKYDDQRVTKVASESLPDEIVNNEAYMLFYQRRSSDNNECSGSSSNSNDHWVSRISASISTTNNSKQLLLKKDRIEDSEQVLIEPVATVRKDTNKTALQSFDKPSDVAGDSSANGKAVIQEIIPEEELPTANCNNLENSEKSFNAGHKDSDGNATEASVQSDACLTETKPLAKHSTEETVDKEQKVKANFRNQDENGEDYNNKTDLDVAVSKMKILDDNQEKNINPSTEYPCSTNESANIITSNEIIPSDTPAIANGYISPSPVLQTIAYHKFNGFAFKLTDNHQQQEATSLKFDKDNIIGSGSLANPAYRQSWYGSRSSTLEVENNFTPQTTASTHPSLHLRHSFSTSSNYRLRKCSETLSSLLRSTANTCSKDTLIFLDQQNHHHHHHHHDLIENANEEEEDNDNESDDNILGGRSLWISPVTPHKLITVSPKN